mmetsp:Transcript_22214/g.36778  ORF Transcript_22214/g.36778 Transcript_22214/m.36778 type:complete len:312 (-) Transcript_22214:157-1092(-)
MASNNDEENPEGEVEVKQEEEVLKREPSTMSLAEELKIEEEVYVYELYPPMSGGEHFRDGLLRRLDSQFFQLIGIIVLFLVIVDGAFFFFLLVGAQGMCTEPSRTDCDPRNWWYNFSVQFLNGLFTWMAIVSMPWRCANWMHIACWGCPHRNNQVGRDLYGVRSEDSWFHLPLRKRGGIIIVLLLNCLAQFANQITRFIYSDFDSQNEFPGNIWTNVFFASSFIFAFIGACWLVYEETQLRKAHPPGTFTPGLLEIAEPYICCCKKKRDEVAGVEAEPHPHYFEHFDPTRHRSLHDIIPHVSRPDFRLFGL